MIFKYKPLTDEEISNHNKFLVYLNYLEAISNFLNSDAYQKEENFQKVAKSRSFILIQPQTNIDLMKIKYLLRNTWFTEIQLNFTTQQQDYAPYSNQWSSVQLYYAIYVALRALFIAMDSDFKKNVSICII